MLARGAVPFRLPDNRPSPAMMLGRLAQPRGFNRGGRIRMADGGSLLETALNAATTPAPQGGNPILQPYPGDYNAYGFGPEWNFFATGAGAPGVTPPPVVPPAGTPGGTGTPTPEGGSGTPASRTEGNGFGGKGPLGNGPAQAAADAAARNTAVNPSLGRSLAMASSFMGPLGMFGLLGKTALSQFGIGQNPFNPTGPTLTAAEQAAIANATTGLPQNAPTVTVMNAIDNAIQQARQQARSSQTSGSFGPGSLGAGAWGGIGSDTSGGMARSAAQQMGRGIGTLSGGTGGPGGGGYGNAGGIGGNGPMGGMGGQGANAGFKRGGKAEMRGLGWLANGGRLHLAGGGSTNNPVLTSLIPIAAGLIGNIVSGPIGGAIASGAATAMTGGSVLDAMQNVGSTSGDSIDSLLKYFPGLVNDTSATKDTTGTSMSAVDPTWATAAALMNKLTSRVPAQSAAAAAPQATTSGTGALPYTKPAMARGGTMPLYANRSGLPYEHGGELDARDGTHVQGEGDGQSDDIPAKLSDGEFVFDSASVNALGNGSNKAGAARLDEMRKMIRQRAGYKNVHTIPPKQKSVAHLLHAVTRKKGARGELQ